MSNLYTAFVDESGSHRDSNILVVAGYVLATADVEVATKRWTEILDRYGVPAFHMVDCAHRRGAFSRLDRAQCDALKAKLIGLVLEYAICGVAAAIPPHRFEGLGGLTRKDVYSYCLHNCVIGLRSQLAHRGFEGSLHVVMEAGHKDQSTADRYMREINDRTSRLNPISASALETHIFAGKQDEPLLQMADLLAWQVAKHIHSRVFADRRMRGDYSVLARHNLIVLHQATRSKTGALIVFDERPFDDTPEHDLQLRDLYLPGETVTPAIRAYYEVKRGISFAFSEDSII